MIFFFIHRVCQKPKIPRNQPLFCSLICLCLLNVMSTQSSEECIYSPRTSTVCPAHCQILDGLCLQGALSSSLKSKDFKKRGLRWTCQDNSQACRNRRPIAKTTASKRKECYFMCLTK